MIEMLRLDLLSWLIAMPLLALCALTDIQTRKIPNRWLLATLPASLIGAIGAAGIHDGLIGSLVGGSIIFALMVGVGLFSRGGVGPGDIKMGAAVGLLVGWPGAAIAVVVTWIPFGLFGVSSKQRSLPMAPFLFVGAAAGLFIR